MGHLRNHVRLHTGIVLDLIRLTALTVLLCKQLLIRQRYNDTLLLLNCLTLIDISNLLIISDQAIDHLAVIRS